MWQYYFEQTFNFVCEYNRLDLICVGAEILVPTAPSSLDLKADAKLVIQAKLKTKLYSSWNYMNVTAATSKESLSLDLQIFYNNFYYYFAQLALLLPHMCWKGAKHCIQQKVYFLLENFFFPSTFRYRVVKYSCFAEAKHITRTYNSWSLISS